MLPELHTKRGLWLKQTQVEPPAGTRAATFQAIPTQHPNPPGVRRGKGRGTRGKTAGVPGGEKEYTRHLKAKQESAGFPGGTVVKNPPANAGDMGSSPGPGRSHMPRSS